MKIGVNFAAQVLREEIRTACRRNNLPAVIVRSILEDELRRAREAEAQAISNEAQLYRIEEAERKKAAERAEKMAQDGQTDMGQGNSKQNKKDAESAAEKGEYTNG